jgi:hypothetical protein
MAPYKRYESFLGSLKEGCTATPVSFISREKHFAATIGSSEYGKSLGPHSLFVLPNPTTQAPATDDTQRLPGGLFGLSGPRITVKPGTRVDYSVAESDLGSDASESQDQEKRYLCIRPVREMSESEVDKSVIRGSVDAHQIWKYKWWLATTQVCQARG